MCRHLNAEISTRVYSMEEFTLAETNIFHNIKIMLKDDRVFCFSEVAWVSAQRQWATKLLQDILNGGWSSDLHNDRQKILNSNLMKQTYA